MNRTATSSLVLTVTELKCLQNIQVNDDARETILLVGFLFMI